MRLPRRLTGLSDAELIARSRHSERAFEAPCERYRSLVIGFLIRRADDPRIALGLVSETFGRARHSPAPEPPQANGSAAPWLFGIASLVLSDWRRNPRTEHRKLPLRAAAEIRPSGGRREGRSK
jgi:DNA-directed RNA polymerase specialized sigma24 family protein